jgi:cell division protein FtsQ
MTPGAAIALRATGALAIAALLAAAVWLGYDALARRPIADVQFVGDTARVAGADLERLAAGLRGKQARDVALPAVRDAVRRVPWVRDCAVRHVFPGTLKVTLESHSPLARWDETRLVSTRGEVFVAEFEGALPRFSGPEGAAAEMAAAWAAISRAAQPLAAPIVELRLSERRAWQARLASGLAIELGRNETEARLARFAAAWPRIAVEAAAATHADLRYPNGFALRGVAGPERKPAPPGKKA